MAKKKTAKNTSSKVTPPTEEVTPPTEEVTTPTEEVKSAEVKASEAKPYVGGFRPSATLQIKR